MAKFVEFQESEVIFSDHNNMSYDFQEMIVFPTQGRLITSNNKYVTNHETIQKNKVKKKIISTSIPVNIPESFSRFRETDVIEDHGDIDDDRELVPPHVIVERRIAGKMAFSVCTGNGRTLKGRDLSQVRNSILRMTGFLET